LTGLVLGCFCCLGLGLVAEHGFKRDYTGREGMLRDGKTNLLLLPLPISILNGFVLGCFSFLGLKMFADESAKKGLDKENLLLPIVCGKEVHFWESWLKTNHQQASECLGWIFKLKSNQHMLISIVVLEE